MYLCILIENPISKLVLSYIFYVSFVVYSFKDPMSNTTLRTLIISYDIRRNCRLCSPGVFGLVLKRTRVVYTTWWVTLSEGWIGQVVSRSGRLSTTWGGSEIGLPKVRGWSGTSISLFG